MLIGGDWVDADERFEIRSPATEELVASVAKGGLEHADRAVAAARAAHADGRWRQTPPAQRAALLDAIADRLTERIDELAVLEALENGAPVRQAGAFQIGFSIAHLRYFAGQARSYAFERPGPLLRVPTLADGIVRREPMGVCAAIVPWNFPLLLAMWKIGPALAAGNTIVVKPDEHTPLTLLEFAAIATECGLPPGVLNVVPGEGPVVGARLASHPDVRKIAFTGSTAVGREIMRMAAGNIKRLTLELGGKGPNIVLDDADLDLAADGTLFACLMNQGQACESGTRVIVADAVHDKFVERLIERAATITVGDPLDPATDFGPVISAEARDRILRYIDSGVAEGATLAYGGGTPGRRAVRARLLGRADDLHRRPQRHDDRPRGDLRAGPGGDPRREHARRRSGSPTTPSTGFPPGSGAPITSGPSTWPASSRPARSGSTTGTWSTPPTRSAGTSRAGWAASSGRTRWMSTPRRSSCTSTCPAGWTAGPIRCCSAPRRPEYRR